MAYIGLPPKANFTSGLLDRFTSTTGTTVTLTHDISSENDIVVFVNFVKQDSTTYSVGGTGNKTLTLGGTLVSSDIVEVHYLNIVGQTVNPSANSVGSSQLTADSITGQTAETSIATDDTVLIHDTSAGALRKMTRANFVSGVGGDNTPAFFAYLSANQTVAHNSTSRINCNTEVVDTDSAYDNSSNYRFTVPSGEGGKYFVFGGVRPNTSTDYEYSEAYISVNGSNKLQTTGRNIGRDSRILNGILDLSAGDYLELQYYQDSGGDITVSGNSTQHRSYFGAYKLIGV